MLNRGEAAEKSRNKSDEKGFMRLYNLRNQKEKNNLLKTEILNNNYNDLNNNTTNKAPKKKTIQERDRYLQNLYKEGLNFMEKHESERTNKQKQLLNQMRFYTNPAWFENNKFFLEKVMQVFRKAMRHDSTQDRNLYEIDEENKFKEEQVVNEKSSFDKQELKKFLFDFGFSLFDFSQDREKEPVAFAEQEQNKKVNNNNNNVNNGVYSNVDKYDVSEVKEIRKPLNKKEKVDLKTEENKLVNLFVDSVFQACDEADKISSDNLFLYVIGILSLYDYFIYSSYKKTNPLPAKHKLNNDSKIANSNKNRKLQKTEEDMALKSQIIQEIKEEKAKKAQKQTRYASLDGENQLIMTDENANNLKKDFHMFYLNFMFKHNIQNNKEIVKVEIENEFKQIATFKPKIDENSKKLYSDYRRKIFVSESHKPTLMLDKTKERNDYIDGLILRKKKKEK